MHLPKHSCAKKESKSNTGTVFERSHLTPIKCLISLKQCFGFRSLFFPGNWDFCCSLGISLIGWLCSSHPAGIAKLEGSEQQASFLVASHLAETERQQKLRMPSSGYILNKEFVIGNESEMGNEIRKSWFIRKKLDFSSATLLAWPSGETLSAIRVCFSQILWHSGKSRAVAQSRVSVHFSLGRAEACIHSLEYAD